MSGLSGNERPPVILVHSSASSGRQWQALAELLQPGFDVLAPDLNGYGSKAGTVGAAGFEDDLDFVKDLIERQASSVHLVGHSYGGLLSARAAFDLRDRVRSLTLIEPVCFHLLAEAGERDALAEIGAVHDLQVTRTARGDLDEAAEGFIDYWMEAGTWNGMPEGARSVIAGAMPKIAAEWPGALSPTTSLDEYGSMPWPVLLVCGSETTLAARTVMALIRDRAGTARYAEIAGGGHMAPVTMRDEVNTVLAGFLTGCE